MELFECPYCHISHYNKEDYELCKASHVRDWEVKAFFFFAEDRYPARVVLYSPSLDRYIEGDFQQYWNYKPRFINKSVIEDCYDVKETECSDE